MPDPGGDGQVITVFSTKGGAGKSVIASNLAVRLAQRSDQPVVLVDADLQFGDVAVMLKLAPQHTIVDAVSSLDRLDAADAPEPARPARALRALRAARTARAGLRRPDRGAEMVRIVEMLRTLLQPTWSSTRRPTSTTWSSA